MTSARRRSSRGTASKGFRRRGEQRSSQASVDHVYSSRARPITAHVARHLFCLPRRSRSSLSPLLRSLARRRPTPSSAAHPPPTLARTIRPHLQTPCCRRAFFAHRNTPPVRLLVLRFSRRPTDRASPTNRTTNRTTTRRHRRRHRRRGRRWRWCARRPWLIQSSLNQFGETCCCQARHAHSYTLCCTTPRTRGEVG